MKTITNPKASALFLLLVACSYINQGPKSNDITVHGSGNLVAKEIDVSDFDSLPAGLHFKLKNNQGEEFKITITSDDNFIDFIQIDQDGSTLSLGLKPGYAYNIYNVTLLADVTARIWLG